MSVRHIPVQLSLDLRLLERVDREAARAETRRSAWIAEAIRQRFENERKETGHADDRATA